MSMKIVAGLGSIDDYELYVEAGADELFCGYIPAEYMLRFGRQHPANRREVMNYNVQIGSESELLILKSMMDKLKVPVSIAYNGLYYTDEERSFLTDTIKHCREMGYTSFIVAEAKLIEELRAIEGIRITVSGELGELNRGVLSRYSGDMVGRVIFPRQTTVEEMARMIENNEAVNRQKDSSPLEYEAFALNEKCHYTGAYCNSLHCDELCHMCKVPYRLVGAGRAVATEEVEQEREVIGATGCAICKLWKLRAAGVTHLKLVSRGNDTESTCEDIRALRTALDILEEAATEREYIERVMQTIFPTGCSGNCYGGKYISPPGSF